MTFHEFAHRYQNFLMRLFGYIGVVRFKDATLALSCFILGALTMAALSGNFVRKLYHVEDFGHKSIKMIRVNSDGKTKYLAHFRNFGEAFQQTLLLAFSPFFTINQYTYRDERRTKRFLIFIGIVGLVLIVLSVLSIYSVLLPDDIITP